MLDGLFLEEMDELFFVLSSADRMKLLSEIKSQELRLTDLAERLSASVQETSKHLGRLIECKLIEKNSGGMYELTPFGKVTFDILPSLSFVSQHRKFFLTHDITFIPHELLLRIGQLSESHFYEHVSNVILECQHLLVMAEKYFYWGIDEPTPWFIKKKFEPDMSVRVLLPRSTTANAIEATREIVGGRADIRFAEQVKVGIALNEKLAGIVFPDREGKIDYNSGFIGYSPEFQKWCRDLFNSMWETSSALWPPELEAEMSKVKYSG